MKKTVTKLHLAEAPVFLVPIVTIEKQYLKKENLIGQDEVFGQATDRLSKQSATQSYTSRGSCVNQLRNRALRDWTRRQYPCADLASVSMLFVFYMGKMLMLQGGLNRSQYLTLAPDFGSLRRSGWGECAEGFGGHCRVEREVS